MVLGEVIRSLEMNAEGLKKFYQSITSLSSRIKGFGADSM